jgi:hypothetical protein
LSGIEYDTYHTRQRPQTQFLPKLGYISSDINRL